MKHIEIYADGATYKQGTGFGVILLSLNHKWQRSFSIGECSANQAVLQAIKFGLLSIADCYKEYPTKLFIRSKYAKDMLDKDGDGYYKANPRTNENLIKEIRTIIEGRNLEIIDGKDQKDSQTCKKLIETAVKDTPIDERK